MDGSGLDFVLLTGSPRPALPRPVRFLGPFVTGLRPPRWGEVSFAPVSGIPGHEPARRVSGAVLLTGSPGASTALVSRCLARARFARRAGARFVALGGVLARDQRLAADLGRAAGLPAIEGLALEAAALLDAALVALSWRGLDPGRARAAVAAGPDDPAPAEAVIEYLADRTAAIGVWGLGDVRRSALAARVQAATGAALETWRSLERCLDACDLVVLTGSLDIPEPVSAPGPLVVDLTSARSRPPRAREEALRLSEVWLPRGRRLPPPTGQGAGRSTGPVRLAAVLFRTPPGWTGRPEPGLERGLVSAPLVEAVLTALREAAAVPPRGRRTGPDSYLRPGRLSARTMARLAAEAAHLGFLPAAAVTEPSLTPVGGDRYNRF